MLITMELFVRNWDEALQRRLKARAALEGKPLREVLHEAAEEWLRNKSGPKKRKGTRNATSR